MSDAVLGIRDITVKKKKGKILISWSLLMIEADNTVYKISK